MLLHADSLDADLVRNTLNIILKFEDDIDNMDIEIPKMIAAAKKAARA